MSAATRASDARYNILPAIVGAVSTLKLVAVSVPVMVKSWKVKSLVVAIPCGNVSVIFCPTLPTLICPAPLAAVTLSTPVAPIVVTPATVLAVMPVLAVIELIRLGTPVNLFHARLDALVKYPASLVQ